MPFVDPGFVLDGFVESDLSLSDLLRNPEVSLNVAVELESAHRVTGAVRIWRFSRFLSPPLRAFDSNFLPFLRSVGSYSQIAADDMALTGLLQGALGSITLIQERPDIDLLSQLHDYTFIGKKVTIKLGLDSPLYPYSAWFKLGTSTTAMEPDFSYITTGIQATITLASVISRLSAKPISVARNVGISSCVRFQTALGYGSAAHLTPTYDLQHFTVKVRFKANVVPSVRVTLCRNINDIAAPTLFNNWFVYLDTTGKVVANASTGAPGSPSLAFTLTSSTALTDNLFHTVILSVDGSSNAYLKIDSLPEISVTPTGLVNFSTSAVTIGKRASGTMLVHILDVEILSAYVEPADAASRFSIISGGNDIACVALWRMDDNDDGVTTAFDYSPNANPLTLHGTVNTDYSWQPTDLGESGLAGALQPFIVGMPFNTPAQLIDTGRQRFRLSDEDLPPFHSIAVRTRELPLALTTDYTIESDGVIQLVSAEPQPVTFDITGGGYANYCTNPTLAAVLSSRSALTSDDVNYQRLTAISFLCPWALGYYSLADLTVADYMSQTLASAGFSYYEDEDGKLIVHFILPPIGLGPYNNAPCLDFRGLSQHGLPFGDGTLGSMSGSHTLICWFFPRTTDATATFSDTMQVPPIGQFLFDKGSNYILSVDIEGLAAGRLGFHHISGLSGTTPSLYAPLGSVIPGVWNFIAAVLDNTGKTRKVYTGHRSGPLTLVASDSGWTGAPATNSQILALGGASPSSGRQSYTWGAVGFWQVWNRALSVVELQAVRDTPPVGTESNLSVYAPADTSLLAVADIISGSFSSIGSAEWCPALTIDLNIYTTVRLTSFKHINPASKIVVRYHRNWSDPMSDADISDSVPLNDLVNYKAKYQEVEVNIPTLPFTSPRTIILETCLTEREDVQRLIRFISWRFSTDTYLATIEISASDAVRGVAIARRLLGVSIADEVRLKSSIPSQLASGRSFEVVGYTKDPLTLNVKIMLLG